MANDLSAIVNDKLLSRGVLTLREQLGLARTVNKDFSAEVAQQGATILVESFPAGTTSAVSPGPTPPAPSSTTPTTTSIALSDWRKSDFHLTEKEEAEIINGSSQYVTGRAGQAIRALANYVNSAVHANYTKVYGYVGTAGTTPFATDTSAAVQARKVLAQQLAPKNPRFAVVNADAEANMLSLDAFANASKTGENGVIIRGEIGEKFGIDWMMDDGIVTHTAGTASGATTDSTGYAAGLKTLALASAGTGSILVGDIITFAGDTQTYTVTEGDSDVSGGGSISFEPGLQVAIAASPTAITVKGDHVVNLAYHPEAFALAMRPLSNMTTGVSSRSSVTDPETGISLMLTVLEEYHQRAYEYSVLFGTACVHPELAVRIAG